MTKTKTQEPEAQKAAKEIVPVYLVSYTSDLKGVKTFDNMEARITGGAITGMRVIENIQNHIRDNVVKNPKAKVRVLFFNLLREEVAQKT